MKIFKNLLCNKKRITILAILIASILIVISVFYFQRLYTTNTESSYIIIKSGSSSEDISKLLLDKAIIKSKEKFKIYAKLNGLTKNTKDINLIIKPNTSYKELILKLKNQQSDFYVVTIPEGFTLYQIAERLEKYTPLKKEKFLQVSTMDLSSNGIFSKGAAANYDLEGVMYPDTYYIQVGSTEKDVANLMFKRFRSIFSDEDIKRAKELNLSVNQVITVASLVEKEAANDSDRSKIAGVIYNRLKKGMPLQIDASVIYAITKGQYVINRLSYEDLKVKDAYNTYLYKGLPPGPIASPGRPSIEAALYPEKSDYLYYVANGKGHVFSKTYEEHLSNVKKYIK
ncbi:endolytic transglycosylase MltG [Clostridium omnivorum]|uniref:Endolytic murein transglycosylase n=1 Tax=Clostridium omnivorum TaxID=1604902 RepID=A0ABQ5NBB8_9CLOT|nr:endolytic transglycosylase MltG [Clostridium sp. E14]GLC32492.1 aminodeoxychorismate lyase [Clostridium sp. E14]